MKHKRVIPRTQAHRDVQETVDYYLNEGAEQAALAFVDAIEQAFRYIGRHPATGSTRYAQELDLPGLRCWPVKRYPYLVFYVERDDHIDVWRVRPTRHSDPASRERLNVAGRIVAGDCGWEACIADWK